MINKRYQVRSFFTNNTEERAGASSIFFSFSSSTGVSSFSFRRDTSQLQGKKTIPESIFLSFVPMDLHHCPLLVVQPSTHHRSGIGTRKPCRRRRRRRRRGGRGSAWQFESSQPQLMTIGVDQRTKRPCSWCTTGLGIDGCQRKNRCFPFLEMQINDFRPVLQGVDAIERPQRNPHTRSSNDSILLHETGPTRSPCPKPILQTSRQTQDTRNNCKHKTTQTFPQNIKAFKALGTKKQGQEQEQE